jgi:membrane-bound lytic murein transglycosylase B
MQSYFKTHLKHGGSHMVRFETAFVLFLIFGLLLPVFSFGQTINPIQTQILTADPRLDYVRNQLSASGFKKISIDNLLSDNRIQQLTIKTVAYKAPNWKLVEQKLYSKTSIQTGVNYIKTNQSIFDAMEKYYGIKSGVIAGIIAIETDFGKNTGNYSVFNVIYSRMELWPALNWKGQAEQLIAIAKYCLNSKLDCMQLKGSYAGAMGLVQFMPNSLLAYGVDGNKDGFIDLFNPDDAIPSAANFLHKHGWDVNQLKSLTSYYGSSVGYPKIVLNYSALVSNSLK